MFTTRSGGEVPGSSLAMVRMAPLASLSFGLSPAQQRRGGRAPFAMLGMVGMPQKESTTGTEFPGQFCVFTQQQECPCKLLGVGVRSKRLLGLKNINVYSLGLYADAPAAKRSLRGKYAGLTGAPLASNQSLYDDVTNAEFEKTLRIVINFGSLTKDKFISTLDEAMTPSMRKAGEIPVLDSFKAQFNDVQLRKGTELLFSSVGKGKLVTQVDGKQVGMLESPALVRSLFNIYLGPDPVSPEAKSNIGTGLAQLLSE